VDVTWEVAANEEEEREDGDGNGREKGDAGFVSDGDRPERLMFDHDYDTDTEAEGPAGPMGRFVLFKSQIPAGGPTNLTGDGG
jgi:hypothetical protein